MRTLNTLLTVAICLSVGAVAEAGPVMPGDRVTFADAPGTTGGGEFLVTVNDLDSFITFCLQRTEYIDFSNEFIVAGVNTYAETDPSAQGGNSQGRDPLSSQTAWLYSQFRAGTLAGYNYNNANRWQSANDLQNAIWWFENELTSDPNNAFVNAANLAVSNGFSGLGNVRVMNLQFRNGAEAQDQLVLVPEPATLALFGAGLGLAGWRLRRRGGKSDAAKF